MRQDGNECMGEVYKASTGITLLHSVALSYQTGIAHRVIGRDHVECARVVCGVLGA
jgi:hypothetical protein